MDLPMLLERFDGVVQTPADVVKLEQAILQLAVMGKLVPQDVADESAQTTVQNAVISRAQIATKKKLSKLPDLGEIALDEILPLNWIWVTLPFVVLFDRHAIKRGPFGSAIKKAYFVPSGYKVYEQKNAIYNDFSLGSYYVDENKYRELEAFTVHPNDIIISCSGTIGKMAIAPENMEPGIINQALLKLSLNNDLLLNEFFKILLPAYLMKTDTLTDLKGTAMKNITSVKRLRTLPFPLPPLEEQKRIVAKVDELFAQTAALSAQLAAAQAGRTRTQAAVVHRMAQGDEGARPLLLQRFDQLHIEPAHVDALKQMILQLAVMGKLVPQDPADEPASVLLEQIASKEPVKTANSSTEIPDSWEWICLGNILKNIVAGKSPQAEKRPAKTEEKGVLKVSAVSWGKFKPNENKTLFRSTDTSKMPFVKKGDLLISRANTSELVGAVVLVENDYPNLYLSDKTLRLDFVSDAFYKPFMLLALRAKWVRELFEDKATGTSNSMQNISQQKIKSAPIAMPPFAEQKRIVAKVEELMGLCDQLSAGLASAEETRERVLAAVVGG